MSYEISKKKKYKDPIATIEIFDLTDIICESLEKGLPFNGVDDEF